MYLIWVSALEFTHRYIYIYFLPSYRLHHQTFINKTCFNGVYRARLLMIPLMVCHLYQQALNVPQNVLHECFIMSRIAYITPLCETDKSLT